MTPILHPVNPANFNEVTANFAFELFLHVDGFYVQQLQEALLN